MKGRLFKLFALTVVIALALTGCAQKPEKPLNGTADNDILTFKSNIDNKPIIRIGTLYYTPDTSFVDAIQAAFPDYLVVLDQSPSAGINSDSRIFDMIKNGSYFDMLITGEIKPATVPDDIGLVDISAEPFLNNYLLTALNGVSLNGHIYSLPGTSTLAGIAFNVDMFNEHGWEIPKTHDEFFALCGEIKAAGIQPFSACLKYTSAVVRLLTMMNYSELFETPEGAKWVAALPTAQAKFKGYMEPVYDLAKRMADTGIISTDFFTASLTKQRHAFWAGESAMIDYDSVIYTYAEAENAPFELGIMPYPAKKAEHAGFAVTPEYYISIPTCVNADAERLKLMKEILSFISTEAGQEAMLADSLRISNVKNISLSGNPAAKYALEAYEKGNLYPDISFSSPGVGYYTLIQETVKSVVEGGSVEEALEYMDEQIAIGYAARPEVPAEQKVYENIAKSEKAFTMLETSYYIADKLREATGADIALMINGGFFRSNLAAIGAGDITSDMDRYVMKGVGSDDWLTTYSLTGAQLKTLLERPIINGVEIDALIAASGTRIEYAPWNERGSRVLSLKLEDGSELKDDAIYTVAAWAGVIDESYITQTLQAYPELGALPDIVLAAFKKDLTLKPDIANRVKLVWPKAKQ